MFKTINATPAQDMPAQVIVLDAELAQRHPGKGFYLRVVQGPLDTDMVDLDGEHTLPGAVALARSKGYATTHWMETTSERASPIPSSVLPTQAT